MVEETGVPGGNHRYVIRAENPFYDDGTGTCDYDDYGGGDNDSFGGDDDDGGDK
jgi:hypothetical protein